MEEYKPSQAILDAIDPELREQRIDAMKRNIERSHGYRMSHAEAYEHAVRGDNFVSGVAARLIEMRMAEATAGEIVEDKDKEE